MAVKKKTKAKSEAKSKAKKKAVRTAGAAGKARPAKARTPPQRVDIGKIHVVSRMLKEIVNYPGHVARTNSPAYTAMHHKLVDLLDLPCLVCGVRKSTLGTPAANPFHATQLETHHHIVEWALANALDLAKFNDRIVRHLRARPTHDPIYDQDFTQEQMLEWVDHHPDNLWVLCNVHHRAQYYGIHSITDPIWGPQDLIRGDFNYIPGDGVRMINMAPPSSET